MSSSRIILGDCIEGMRTLADASVHCCVTSPPYFGLRDYGVDGQIGLESTVDEFVGVMVRVFDEVRRVLRDDGTLWLNLGDSYAAQRSGTAMPAETLAGGQSGQSVNGRGNRGRGDAGSTGVDGRTTRPTGSGPAHRNASALGLKHKDLIGVPWAVAFALRASGWYLRQDIIWHKPNPMPESVRDRCTKAHEYVFLMSKSARYHFDLESFKVPCAAKTLTHRGGGKAAGKATSRDGIDGVASGNWGSSVEGARVGNEMVNRRSVWTVNTHAYPGAHFATYPPDLVEPCVLAGCPEGGTVLDPFAGSGTTGVVATAHGRNFIGCELNPEYAVMAGRRIAEARSPSCYRSDEVGDAPLFTGESA